MNKSISEEIANLDSLSLLNLKTKKIGIIIPTYRAEAYIKPLLEALKQQQIQNGQIEILIVDSASGDKTEEIAANYSVCSHRIEQKKFSHPGTRNLGASLIDADYLVFMTQDALPENPFWLQELVRPLENNPQVAASYSRQIPRPGCNPLEARDIALGAPAIDEIRQFDPLQEHQVRDYKNNLFHYIRFSNVSACYRAELLKAFPFDETLPMVEDQEWARRMIEKGYAIYYASKSVVVHSHEHSAKQTFERYYDYGRSFHAFLSGVSRPDSWKDLAGKILQDIFWIAAQKAPFFWKLRWSLKSFPIRFAAFRGFRKGWGSD